MRTTNILSLLMALATIAATLSLAQEADRVRLGVLRATRATTLRDAPSGSAPARRPIASGARLDWVEGQQAGGFSRVLVPEGQQGWVSSADIEVVSPPSPTDLAAAAGPCFLKLSACPEIGCAKPDTDHAFFNQAKHRKPVGTPLALSFPDFAALQDQAETLVGQGHDLSKAKRDLLVKLKVSSGVVKEGSLVQITGFIADGLPPHANTGESVNCRLTKPQENDFHISLAPAAGDSEFKGIVVEMIPQGRSPKVTTTKLTGLRTKGRRVLVAGQLFYDNIHVANGDSAHPLSGQPKRFSLWEVHPITRFLVCKKPDNSCAASAAGDWTPIESF